MLRQLVAVGTVLVISWAPCLAQTAPPAGQAAKAPPPQAAGSTAPKAEDQGAGMAAIKRAADAKKYLFVFFFKQDDEATGSMRKVFDAAVTKLGDKADSIAIDITAEPEKPIVAKYGVARAPMPLALALAPNGAVTGGFPAKFDETRLLDAVVSPGMQACLKPLQERKLVLLCFQNKTTKALEAAMKGVNDFKADKRFAAATVVVTVDPADAGEAKLAAQLKVDPKTDEAVTALMAPPGVVVGVFNGATKAEDLVSALTAASSGGCGPGGCGPGGCK